MTAAGVCLAVSACAPKPESLSIDPGALIMKVGEEATLTAVVAPDNAKDKSVTWSSSAPEVASIDASGKITALSDGMVTISARTNEGGKAAMCGLTVKPAYTGVQLWAGGPYWATTNIGAENPEDFGMYFSWGNVSGFVPRDGKFSYSFDENTYAGSFAIGLTGSIPADASNDAARSNWSGKWRLPDENDFKALLDSKNCEWVYCDGTTVKYNGKSVKGFLVKGKGAFGSREIFLPEAGYGNGTDFTGAGSYSCYWSSTRDKAGRICQLSLNGSAQKVDYGTSGFMGCSIRPVYSE